MIKSLPAACAQHPVMDTSAAWVLWNAEKKSKNRSLVINHLPEMGNLLPKTVTHCINPDNQLPSHHHYPTLPPRPTTNCHLVCGKHFWHDGEGVQTLLLYIRKSLPISSASAYPSWILRAEVVCLLYFDSFLCICLFFVHIHFDQTHMARNAPLDCVSISSWTNARQFWV